MKSKGNIIEDQAISIREIVRKFKSLELVAGGKIAASRKIFSGLVIQPGLELSGFFLEKYVGQAYLFGYREQEYINRVIKDDFRNVIENILKQQPPCLIFDNSFKYPKFIVQLANKYNVAVLQVSKNENSFSYHFQNFLAQRFVPHAEVHASCLTIFGCGVLIFGESGVGKSEVTLELVKKKHLFICDDRVLLKRIGNEIHAFSPEVIKNLIEVRGIGILDVKQMFGVQACLETAKIEVAINLLALGTRIGEVDRLGTDPIFKEILEVPINLFELPVRHGRAMSDLVETSIVGYLLRKGGLNTTKELNKRIKEAQKRNGERN